MVVHCKGWSTRIAPQAFTARMMLVDGVQGWWCTAEGWSTRIVLQAHTARMVHVDGVQGRRCTAKGWSTRIVLQAYTARMVHVDGVQGWWCTAKGWSTRIAPQAFTASYLQVLLFSWFCKNLPGGVSAAAAAAGGGGGGGGGVCCCGSTDADHIYNVSLLLALFGHSRYIAWFAQGVEDNMDESSMYTVSRIYEDRQPSIAYQASAQLLSAMLLPAYFFPAVLVMLSSFHTHTMPGSRTAQGSGAYARLGGMASQWLEGAGLKPPPDPMRYYVTGLKGMLEVRDPTRYFITGILCHRGNAEAQGSCAVWTHPAAHTKVARWRKSDPGAECLGIASLSVSPLHNASMLLNSFLRSLLGAMPRCGMPWHRVSQCLPFTSFLKLYNFSLKSSWAAMSGCGMPWHRIAMLPFASCLNAPCIHARGGWKGAKPARRITAACAQRAIVARMRPPLAAGPAVYAQRKTNIRKIKAAL
eukprot:1161970-Pelagomonas_calceolata.AAC.1